MVLYKPLTPTVDSATDRGRIERVKASGPADSTEETAWVDLIIVSGSAPSDPGLYAFWWDSGDKVLSVWDDGDGTWYGVTGAPDLTEIIMVAVSDETTTITTGTAKVTFRMPFAATLDAVRSSLTTVSSSGLVTVDINEAGATVLSTKLSIDASEKTSTTAATAAVISDAALADDAEITIDIDAAGTGAKGLKVTLICTRVP